MNIAETLKLAISNANSFSKALQSEKPITCPDMTTLIGKELTLPELIRVIANAKVIVMRTVLIQQAADEIDRLREYVGECANDAYDRTSPLMRAKAQDLLESLNK